MIFITDYHSTNKRLVRNPQPITSIGNMMNKPKVLQYSTLIYPNMGYYKIQLSTQIKDTETILTKFGKFS